MAFGLVLDRNVDECLANLHPSPELYKELTEGRSLSYRAVYFFVRALVMIYHGLSFLLIITADRQSTYENT